MDDLITNGTWITANGPPALTMDDIMRAMGEIGPPPPPIRTTQHLPLGEVYEMKYPRVGPVPGFHAIIVGTSHPIPRLSTRRRLRKIRNWKRAPRRTREQWEKLRKADLVAAALKMRP